MNAPTLSTGKETIPIHSENETGLISISEIFGPTIQGEGALIGTQTIFVRTAGCDYRCSWCDTGYAVLPDYQNDWINMRPESIFEEIESLSNEQPMWITLSGGNPAMQNLEALIKLVKSKGYRFSMETQGSISKPWFALLDQLTLSPKPPSSEMKFKKRGLERCLDACIRDNQTNTDISLKFVVADQNDLIWAKQIAEQYPQLSSYVQPCNIGADIRIDNRSNSSEVLKSEPVTEQINQQTKQQTIQHKQMLWLIEAVQSLGWNNVKVLPQLHTWLWGDKTGV